MKTKELVNALRRHSAEYVIGLNCLGCGYEHSCSTRGCKILRLAADELERLQNIAMDPDSVSRAEKQAIFRLGQMDAQQSAALMLRNMAECALGISQATLRIAADCVEGMKVSGSDTGGVADG